MINILFPPYQSHTHTKYLQASLNKGMGGKKVTRQRRSAVDIVGDDEDDTVEGCEDDKVEVDCVISQIKTLWPLSWCQVLPTTIRGVSCASFSIVAR